MVTLANNVQEAVVNHEPTAQLSFFTRKSAKPHKILYFLSMHSPHNILNWSGILNSLYESLRENDVNVRVVELGSGKLLSFVARNLNRVLYRLGCRVDCRLTTVFAFLVGVSLSVRLLFKPAGPIVAVAASNYLSYIFSRRTIIYISDATHRASLRIYPEMKQAPDWLSNQCDLHELRSLRRANFTILPSEWAVKSAIDDYGIPANKIYRLPFSANITREQIEKFIPKQRTILSTEVTFLFVAADWERKGGDKAIEVCRAFIRSGFDARLIVIGSSPDRVREIPFVEVKGFLRKANPDELSEICRAYQRSHFLLLPTLADASPIVFAEAQAFGVPPITHDVGGTASSMEHGKTGILMHIDAKPGDFVEAVTQYITHAEQYEALSQRCRAWYLREAQWSKWRDLILRLGALSDEIAP